jgi:hypothetical protein
MDILRKDLPVADVEITKAEFNIGSLTNRVGNKLPQAIPSAKGVPDNEEKSIDHQKYDNQA